MAKGKKTGGRKPGTPNKVSRISREVIAGILDRYETSGLMAQDMDALEPRERLDIAVKLMQFVLPKMQSTAVDLTASLERRSIEDDLSTLAEDLG